MASGVLTGTALGAGAVQGLMISDGVTGRSVTPHGWIEENAYVGKLNVGFGAGCVTLYQPPGWFSVSGSYEPPGFPAGTYALFTLNFDGAPAFGYRADLVLPGGSTVVDNVRLKSPAHYSVMYNETYSEWGTDPWIWGTDFYQTFVATTEHVTRIATKLAGKGGDHAAMLLNFALVRPNAGLPSTWTQILATRRVWLSGGTDPIIHIFFVPYRSNEVELVVGQAYAARFWRDPSSDAPNFAIVARRDSNNGYAGGHLYAGNTPHPELDAYAYISGGEPGTIVNHAAVADLQFIDLVGWSTRYGQTFRASGAGLAAVDIVYATGDPNPPSLPFTFQVYSNVGGTPIGISKKCYGVSGFYQARAAALWAQGEVPLVPGQMYYIEWTSPGCNTWRMNEDVPGEAYVERQSRAPADLVMSIAEYERPPVPPPVAGFVGNPRRGQAPLTVSFTDQSTGLIDSRSWTFGDGGISTETNPTHGYFVPGTYTVALTVMGPAGSDSETKTGYIVVDRNIGDFDDDGDVDQGDFGHLQVCFTGAGVSQLDPACRDARLDDDDDDVDQDDFNIFQRCTSGERVPADPACVE